MERFRGPIMLVAALILAVVTTFLIYNWRKKQVTPKVEAPKLMQPVAAAAIDLHWGTKLSPDMLKVILLPKKNLPGGYYASIEAIKDRVLKTSIVINEPVLASKLAPEGTKAGLYGVIAQNKRAMSVRVDDVVGVSGFVYPGSHVDILVTIGQSGREKGTISKIVLQDIPVMAVGTQMEVKEGEAIPVKVVTLEVTPKQAEKLALAAGKGRIRLALRSASDTRTVATKGITTEGLLMGSRTKKPGVEIIRGSKISMQSL